MNGLLATVGLITALLALDLAAMLWGADSRDGPESAEWERLRSWRGYRR